MQGPKAQPAHTLIVAPQWIGDAVMTEPLLRALCLRGQTLCVLATPWVAPVYEAMRHLEGLRSVVSVPFQHGGLQWSARKALASRIRRGEWGAFARAYVLPNSFKSALLPWLAGIRSRTGYHGEQRFGLLTQRLPNPPRHTRGSMVAHYLALCQIRDAENGVTRAQREGAVCTDARPRLTVEHVQPNDLTLVVPGAEYGSAKRWGEASFATLIAQLTQQDQGRVALLGSAKEVDLCEAVRQQACRAGALAHRVENLAGRISLHEAIALIAGARQMVSNDSGLMHVAAAFAVPQVAIFGSSDPRHTPPLNDRAVILWQGYAGLQCTPCFSRSCPKEGVAHLACMKAIAAPQVLEALEAARLGRSHSY